MLRSSLVTAIVAASAVILIAALAGCGEFAPSYMKPLPPQTRALLAQKGMKEDAPILVRIFKAESELEVWKAKDDGRFYLSRPIRSAAIQAALVPRSTRATGRRRKGSISSRRSK